MANVVWRSLGEGRRVAVVAPIHPKAMPAILTTPEEFETWMTAPVEEALKLQQPLPDGLLRVVAKGAKHDGGEVTRVPAVPTGH